MSLTLIEYFIKSDKAHFSFFTGFCEDMKVNNLHCNLTASVKHKFCQICKNVSANTDKSHDLSLPAAGSKMPLNVSQMFKVIYTTGLLLGCASVCKHKFLSKIQGLVGNFVNKTSDAVDLRFKKVNATKSLKDVDCALVNKSNGGTIPLIRNDKEYIDAMQSLMKNRAFSGTWKLDGADIFDLGIQPYAGIPDMHSGINAYIKENRMDDAYMNNLISCLRYSLQKADEKYGKYNGIVYRYGFFGEDNLDEIVTQGFVSTSKSLDIFKSIGRSIFLEDCNIILTSGGHKVYKIQEQLEKFQKSGGMKYSKSEAEVLLDHNERYRRIFQLSPKLKEIENNLIQYLLSISKFHNHEPEIIDPSLYKIKFWQKID